MVRKEEHATVWQNSADTTQPIKSEKFQNEYQLGGRYISPFLKRIFKKKKYLFYLVLTVFEKWDEDLVLESGSLWSCLGQAQDPHSLRNGAAP